MQETEKKLGDLERLIREALEFSLLYSDLGYRGEIDTDAVVDFLETRLARKQIPEIKPEIESLPTSEW